MVEAVNAQRARLTGDSYEGDMWTAARAERFRADPRREPEPLLQAIMGYLRPEDVLLDVGGGAGRFGLPLALHCRELIDVDPSGGMRQVFEDVARDAGIKNARYLQSDWLHAEGVSGDVSLVSSVTYFVADIVPFIEKLHAASRRRVCIVVVATPPPNGGADIFEVLHGEPQALLPGHRELLPVLWDLKILPEVRLAGINRGPPPLYASREEAILDVAPAASPDQGPSESALAALTARFDDLFVATEGGFRRRNQPDGRQLLITWETV
jgi:hypothetical protein